MSHRYYVLHLTNQDCNHNETFRLRKTLQNLELIFKDPKISGEDQILILDFLTRLVEEADTWDISEGQLMVMYPSLLKGNAYDQYRAAANG